MNTSSSLYLRLLVALIVLTISFSVHAQSAPSADIVVSKSGDEAVALGGQITYSLTVFNAGPDDAVNIVLTDVIPAHTTFVNASTNNGSVSFDGTTLTVNVGTLAFDSTATATLIVQVDQNTPGGTIISNTVTGTSDTSDPETSNNSATALTAITGPFAGDVLISEFRLQQRRNSDRSRHHRQFFGLGARRFRRRHPLRDPERHNHSRAWTLSRRQLQRIQPLRLSSRYQ